MSATLPHDPSRRRAVLMGAGLLAGCGGGDAEAPSPPPSPPPPEPVPQVRIEGLSGRKVFRLRDSALGLLAVTDAGLFVRREGTWLALGLPGLHLLDACSLSSSRLLASSLNQGLFESDDGGRSWHPMRSTFGGAAGPEPAYALLPASGRLLATHAGGFAESVDGGRSWALRVGNWGSVSSGMSALTEGENGEVWFGGQNAIEELVLSRWRSTSLFEWSRLLPSPSAVKSVRLVAAQPQRALVCGEGGIVQTLDDGRRWLPVFVNPDYRFHFDVLPDPLRPRRWVTASYRKTDAPQPLRMAVSDDDGANWREWSHGDDALFGGALSLHASIEAGQAVYRFGLSQGGVARVVLPA